MYNDVKKNKVICRYMESLALHTVAPTVHWEDNTSCIYSAESKIVTPSRGYFTPKQILMYRKLLHAAAQG